MTSYTDLVAVKTTAGSIKDFVNSNAIPSTTILTEAEAWIYKRLRAREMIAEATGNLTATSDTLTLPTGYRQPKLFMFTGTTKKIVPFKPLDEVIASWGYDGSGARTTGQPDIFSTDATNVRFDKKADATYTYFFLHYRALAALSGANLTNALTEVYPSLLRATCMMFAFGYLKDNTNHVKMLKIAEAEIAEANRESDLELSTVDLQMIVDGDYAGGMIG